MKLTQNDRDIVACDTTQNEEECKKNEKTGMADFASTNIKGKIVWCSESHGLSTGAIVGIIAGSVVAIIIIIVIIVKVMQSRKHKGL